MTTPSTSAASASALVLTSRSNPIGSLLIAAYLAPAVSLAFVVLSPETRHWFVIPVTLCGVLVIADAVDWLIGRTDLFDPAGILGALGVHQFFVAPFVHVHLDRWMLEVVGPSDWRPWLGGMACLNLVGLFVYRLVRTRASRGADRASRPGVVWSLDRRRFLLAAILVAVASIVAQIGVYRSFGGIAGYIRAYTQDPQNFRGWGWILVFSESFPILGFIAIAEALRRRPAARSWVTIIGLLFTFTVVQFLAAGLRGSRANTVFALFWAAGIAHGVLRPLPRKLVMVGLVAMVAFLYGYGFYKGVGTDVVDVISGDRSVSQVEQETGRTLDAVFLWDLGRSDVQAFLLYRLTEGERGLGQARGRTYLGALCLLIPRGIWPDRPATKLKEGTEVLFGKGAYRERSMAAARVYGMAGEAMLNFGPLAAPLPFAVLGFAVGRLRRFVQRLSRQDARIFLVPITVLLVILAVGMDSDNLLVLLVKNVSIPLAVILMATSGRR